MKRTGYDFAGYATRANVRCADGRTILTDAFADQDGDKVAVVWQHQRNDPENVLGHGILERREDGMYIYGYLNNSPKAVRTKALLEHGDVTGLSIFANNLTESRKQVSHGTIREVSIVIAPANPGARIDNVTIQHGDSTLVVEDEAVIYSGIGPDEICHADESDSDEDDDSDSNSEKDMTPREVFNTLNPMQKKLFYATIAHVMDEQEDEDDDDVNHSDEDDDEGENDMKRNPFDQSADSAVTRGRTLEHSDIVTIVENARRCGSLKTALNDYVIEHADEFGIEADDSGSIQHGIDNLDILFPEAKTLTPTPEFLARQQEWVPKVWNAIRKSPFARIKTVFADITQDEARAKGYIKGKKKVEEQFGLLKRVTTPQTVYKKQRLDRDDIVDIVDINVIAWMKGEMRTMLNEELARAALVGDGRAPGVDDKISEDHIRPIYKDAELYAIHKLVDIKSDDATREEKTDAIIDAVYEARTEYRGSGSPSFFCTSQIITTMLLARDNIGRRFYNTEAELASALRCREIVEVPVMDGMTRETDSNDQPTGYEKTTKYDLLGIIANLSDYTIGADRGGAVTLFDDFDIDFNQFVYLIETRVSGALYRPKSAIVLEKKHTGE